MAILKERRNCRRISHADKASFIIDGAAYFEAFADAVSQARKSVFIAGWDIDGRVRLLKRDDSANDQNTLGEFLNAKAKSTPGLHVHVLNWDFPMLYAIEREWLPIFNPDWTTHRRIRFHWDDEHPIGASQHQKFVVIDNRVAFCGGLDLTSHRWDTPEHRLDDPRRKTPDGKPYEPFHDVQIAVQGETAAVLGQLFRDRWKWATGNHIDLERIESSVPWPRNVSPDLTDISVAVSRTLPAYKGRKEVREVENLYMDGIAAAKKAIYIESQYLTSFSIAEALANSLSLEDGPDVCIVLPKESSGWLEQSTMDSLRARLLDVLFEADRHRRLRVLYPALDDGETSLYVHSKLMIVDDRLALIGSANLSNRSMSFDSECDLAIEAEGDPEAGQAIVSLRDRLIAEHLGAQVDAVSEALSGRTSMNKAIESLAAPSGRRLKNLEYKRLPAIDGAGIVKDHQLLDPEAPIEFDRMMDRFTKEGDKGRTKKRQAMKIAGVLLILLALAAAWRWSPLSEWIDKETLAAWAVEIRDYPLSFLAILGAYVVGGFLMIPVTLLIGVTAIVHDPVRGVLYAWSGCLLSALFTFLAGSMAGKRTVRKLAGKKLNRLSREMAKQGILAVAMIRNIPVAPFSIVNLIAGASHIRLKDYLIGTAIGMLPGILVITVFADRLLQAIQNPGWINVLVAAVLAAAMIFGNLWGAKRLTGVKRKEKSRKLTD